MKRLETSLKLAGLDFVRLFQSFGGVWRFARDWKHYNQSNSGLSDRFPLLIKNIIPMLTDWHEDAGTVSGHYFHQDLWAARKIYAKRPGRHVDLGSRIDGFIAHLLTFMDVDVIDIRPLPSKITGLTFIRDDGATLSRLSDKSVESLSSLHAVEHFGLGRYGDPVDPNACFKAMAALARVLADNGTLYFSVPVGRERVRFNSHRVFSPFTIIEMYRNLSLELISFSAVDDNGDFIASCKPDDFLACRFACGLFEFTKHGLSESLR